MDTFQFDVVRVRLELGHLAPELRASFAAACAQRLTPVYSWFADQKGSGDPGPLQVILALLWDDLLGHRTGWLELESQIEACALLAPSADCRPWAPSVPAARDAVAAVGFALQCRRTGLPTWAVEAVRRAFEVVSYYVALYEAVDRMALPARDVNSHPFVQAELLRQSRDLRELRDGEIGTPGLRNRAISEPAILPPSDSVASKIAGFFHHNRGHVSAALEELPVNLRVAFAAACVQRMLPLYVSFAVATGRGDPGLSQAILARVWTDLTGHLIPDRELEGLLKSAVGLVPREEDGPWLEGQGAAQDAATALVLVLRCRQSGDALEAAQAATSGFDMLEQFTAFRGRIDRSAASARARAELDPVVQAELARQHRDLVELKGDRITITGLRDRSITESAHFHQN
ncbi:MAG TPA: DUF416 family protein [Blastocatellia bacterium]|nr:DUF416 family protein [Blastocatellia bacterium]